MSTIRMALMSIARKEIGVREIVGGKHNPRVLEYHSKTSLMARDDETSWCSSFVNWCVSKAGIVGTNSASARSWLNWGRASNGVFGDIVVFWRGKRSGWMGHVGFVVKKNWFTVSVLGGNQGNKVCVKKYPRYKVLGYRTI